MNPFEISAGEAVLIGACFGAFETEGACNSEARFEDFVPVYLSPFVPRDLGERYVKLSDPHSQLPDDMEWGIAGRCLTSEQRQNWVSELRDRISTNLATSDGPAEIIDGVANILPHLEDDVPLLFEFCAQLFTTAPEEMRASWNLPVGYSPANPAKFYFVACGEVYESWRDESRRFLPGLLQEYLLADTADEAVLEDSYRKWGRAEFNRLCGSDCGALPSTIAEGAGSLAMDEMRIRLLLLVNNGSDRVLEHFEIGCELGYLLHQNARLQRNAWTAMAADSQDDAQIDHIDACLRMWFGPTLCPWDTRVYYERLEELLRRKEIPDWSRGLHLLKLPQVDDDEIGDGYPNDVLCCARHREHLMILLMEIMARESKDGPHVDTPYPHRLDNIMVRKSANADTVRECVSWIYKLLPRHEVDTPTRIMTLLGHSVEALTKRLRPPASGAFYNISEELRTMSRCSHATDNEKRFASLALHLYKTHRNEVTHDFDDYKCVWREAFLFIDAIELLLYYHDQIIGKKATS